MQRELNCYSNDLHEALIETKLALTFGNAVGLSLGIKMQLSVMLTDWLTNLPSLLNLLSILPMLVGAIARFVVVSFKKSIPTLEILTLKKPTWPIILLM